jgi:hypothetical protein
MLISMPTNTSTILGVFQAILALLVKKPDELFRCGTGADVDQASAAVLTTHRAILKFAQRPGVSLSSSLPGHPVDGGSLAEIFVVLSATKLSDTFVRGGFGRLGPLKLTSSVLCKRSGVSLYVAPTLPWPEPLLVIPRDRPSRVLGV